MTDNENMEMVPIVDLHSPDGKITTFEILDEIEFEGNNYVILTEFVEEIPVNNPEAVLNIMVMKFYDNEDGSTGLENIEDKSIVDKIFDIFVEKQKGISVE